MVDSGFGYNITENVLYVGVEIDDDVTVLDTSRTHDGGGFRVRPSHSPGRAEHYGVWGDNTRRNRTFRATHVDEKYVDFGVRRANGHHVYEWRLDVAGIGVTRIEPGALWSFTTGAMDVDGEDRRSFSQMTWGPPGQGSGFRPGDMLLVADTDVLGAIEGHLSWTDHDDRMPPRQLRIQAESDSTFQIRLNTDDQGRYSATLPPGSYQLAIEDKRTERDEPFHFVARNDTVTLDTLRVVRTRPSDYYAALVNLARVHRGVCWVAAGNNLTEFDMLPLVRNGVEWISQTTFGWQTRFNSPEIRLNRQSSGGESDAGIAAASRMARRFGIRTMLKPHIWLPKNDSGKWRRDISMDSEEEWRTWFEHYRTFILRYARLAEDTRSKSCASGLSSIAQLSNESTTGADS